MYLRSEKVCAEPYVQYTSNIEMTVCTTENTIESRSSIKNTFHNVVEKRNPYQSKNRRRRPEPTLASLLSPAYSVSYPSRTLRAVCWEVRMRLRYVQCEE
jgi:hypothetical protein